MAAHPRGRAAIVVCRGALGAWGGLVRPANVPFEEPRAQDGGWLTSRRAGMAGDFRALRRMAGDTCALQRMAGNSQADAQLRTNL